VLDYISLLCNSGLGQLAVRLQLDAYNYTMQIKAYQITANKTIPLDIPATSLDEMTSQLPEGFYTTFSTLAHGTKVLGLKTHLQRLYLPAQVLKLYPPVYETELRKRIAKLVQENLPGESRVRLILTKDKGQLFIGVQPFEPLADSIYVHGVKTITTKISRHDPRIKDSGFISASAEQRRLLNRDVFEILLTKNEKILEGMTSNFYAVKGRTMFTASRGILLGVTRSALLKVARGQGMSIEYRAPRLNEIFNEAFLTSSSRGVVPIISIDGKSVGQGSVGKWTKILSKAFQACVIERSEKILTSP
jgi:branched-chain amino acid aminotransferase